MNATSFLFCFCIFLGFQGKDCHILISRRMCSKYAPDLFFFPQLLSDYPHFPKPLYHTIKLSVERHVELLLYVGKMRIYLGFNSLCCSLAL